MRPAYIIKLAPDKSPRHTTLAFSTVDTYVAGVSDLLLACHQIHDEFKPFFFSEVVVNWFSDESGDDDHVREICGCLDKMHASYTKHIRILRIEFFHFTDEDQDMHDVMNPESWFEIHRRLSDLKKLILHCFADGDTPGTSARDYLDQPDDPECEKALREDLRK